ncbi:hypothetical protein [Sphingomonas gei]|uniref:hypothetical protein n=1 Tax=Sphingomonas gei TaxID=1395960 RepID=UPI001441BBCB|nr:hypothetical protein [Sphingomonas gei]
MLLKTELSHYRRQQNIPLGLDAMERLLSINMDLRRLYDTTASRHLESFDKATTPLMGWKVYLARCEEEVE